MFRCVSTKCSSDAGYHNIKELKKISEKGISVIVPPKESGDRHHREGFVYNKINNTLTCPEGKTLRYQGFDPIKHRYRYCMVDGSVCSKCKQFGSCTNSHRGRWLNILVEEELVQELASNYRKNEAIYSKRKARVELPFGHFRSNINFSTFLLRGLKGVQAELALIATNFNITRMINILNVHQIKEKLA